MHPLSETDKLPFRGGGQIRTFFKLNWTIHKRSTPFIAIYVIAILLSFDYVTANLYSFDIKDSTSPDVTSYKTSKEILYDELQYLNSSIEYSPRTDFAKELISGLPSISFADFKSFSDSINMNPINPGISVDSYNETTHDIQFTSIADTRYYSPQNILECFFFPALKNVTNTTKTNLSTSFFPCKGGKFTSGGSNSMISYLVVPIIFVIIQFLIFTVNQSTSKLQFLLRINSLTETMMWGTYIFLYLLELFPLTILTTFFFCWKGSAQGTSFGLILLISTIHSISCILMMLACSIIIRGKAGSAVFTVIDLLFLAGAIVIGSYLEQVPKSIINLTAILLPHSAFMYSLIHCVNMNNKVGPLSLSLINYKDILSFSWTLVLQVFQMIVSLMALTSSILFNPRAHGLPIIGWKNIFNLKKWKKAFGSRKVGEYLNVSKSINIERVKKVYKGKVKTVALNNISMNMEEGEIIALVGPNGSGKSTLINSLTGEISFDSGTITAYGDSLSNGYDEMYKYMGTVFQEDAFIEKLTTNEMLTLFGNMNNLTGIEVKAEIEKLSSLLKISDCLNTPSDKLSGGQKRKLNLAMALMRRPSLLILDEPTSGVDATSRKIIWKTLSSFDNMTVLVSTHALEEAESVCSRIIVMRDGKVAFEGAPANLRSQFLCGYVLTDASETANIDSILRIAQQIAPEAKANPDNRHSVIIPADLRATDVLLALEANKNEIGLDRYTLHVENLEEAIVKIVMNDEVKAND